MQRYVAGLQDQWIRASTKGDRDLTVRRLAYTFDKRALPTLLDALHGDDRLMPRLIAIAETVGEPARIQAVQAIATIARTNASPR